MLVYCSNGGYGGTLFSLRNGPAILCFLMNTGGMNRPGEGVMVSQFTKQLRLKTAETESVRILPHRHSMLLLEFSA